MQTAAKNEAKARLLAQQKTLTIPQQEESKEGNTVANTAKTEVKQEPPKKQTSAGNPFVLFGK